MKVGVLTFHRAENFGTVLQVYALQEYILSLGHEVEIIDYRNKAIERAYNLFDFHFLIRKNIFASLSTLFIRIVTFKDRSERKNKYRLFREKYLRISKKKYFSKDDFGNKYDVYICGSDQIWNNFITGGLDPIYFLNFETKKGIKKIAYAASSESSAYEYYKEHHNILQEFFENFNAISVREDSLAIELQNYISKKIETVLDPTFLFDRLFYMKILKDPNVRNYILVYHVYESRLASTIAKNIAKEKGLSIIEIHAGFKVYMNKEQHKQNLDPLELLGFICFADIILTTSFHGTALSLIFNKNFYVIDKGYNTRLRDLLNLLEIENRLINSSHIGTGSPIDYSKVQKILFSYIDHSKYFIVNNINANQI
jgi:hypothetical protein